MSNIKDDLQTYLSRNDGSSNNGLGINIPLSIKASDVKGWFTGPSNSSNVEAAAENSGNGWFNQAQKDPLFPSLGRKQRIFGFVACLFMGILCFTLAGFYAPFLLLKARKFALLYTLGSLFTICSFSFLWGPVNHAKHLLSVERLPFTTAYFGTLFGTLYFALSIQSTFFTVLFAVLQVIALLWFVISYIPGGQTGLKFFSKICSSMVSKTVSKTLPV